MAKMKILVQNMYSLETLAHVDTLCPDKTGTITDGKLRVRRVIPMGELPQGETENLLKAYMAACEDNNATFQALREAFPPVQGFQPVHRIPENLERELDKGRRGIAVTGIILLFSLLAPFDVRQRQTVMYLLLILISMAAVVKSCIPFNGLRLFICVTMAGGTFFALAILPFLFQVEPVTAGMAAAVLMGGAMACLLLLILEQIRRQGMRRREQRRMVKPEC